MIQHDDSRPTPGEAFGALVLLFCGIVAFVLLMVFSTPYPIQ
jgi:hypothetical protein